MQTNKCIECKTFPCVDVNKDCYVIPDVDVKEENIKVIMISEAAPAERNDYYYAKGNPSFQKTTVQAFNDAGIGVTSINELLDLGVYLTSAVKCGKTGYGLKANTIKECSFILEKEITLFPKVKVYLLMGDVAIKAFNYIALRKGESRVIPSGSTYKIRDREYLFQGKRVFPSYLQVGPSFNIEKSKRRMIAEDIACALNLV
ncbi:MAG: uracil-DNA glycosylase family protein [Chloroflexota bacterium]